MKTLQWCDNVLVEDYLHEHIRRDMHARSLSSGATFSTPDLPDEFWLAVAESAIETILFELHRLAQSAHAQPLDQQTDGEPID